MLEFNAERGFEMGYKLIACDLDGTMFGNDFQPHENNIRLIRAAVENGTVFAIASGRPCVSVLKVAKLLGLDRKNQHIICFNGASVAEADTGREIYGIPLSDGHAHHVIATAKAIGISLIAYINGEAFSYREDSEVMAYHARVGAYVTIDENLETRQSGCFNKVLLRGKPEALKKAEARLSGWAEGKTSIVYSDLTMLEFFNINASKGNALLYLAEKLGINREETLAIGDYYNDISMLEAAGLGVAIKDAPEAVIRASGYITERTAQEGAVSEVLEKFVL